MSEEKQTKKVGLALGGGGAKGIAHIGVIKELERCGVEISFICGTSMGALIGGIYAATGDIQFLEDFFLSIQKDDIFPATHMMRKKDGEVFKHSLLEKIEGKIRGIKIQDTKIPFSAIATDVETGDEIVLREGDLLNAIKASTALPLVFPPIRIDERLLMDGGFVNPVPADVVRGMGAECIIAVDVSSKWVNLEKETSLNPMRVYSMLPHALSIVEYQLARTVLKEADVILRPSVLGYRWNDFEFGKEFMRLGTKETREHMEEIYKKIGITPPKKKPFDTFADLIFYGIDSE
ncbi:MAG: patatin-like phospholipase family protein [Candidatus Paceibacterota bacterium]|jgi:NTE family protein